MPEPEDNNSLNKPLLRFIVFALSFAAITGLTLLLITGVAVMMSELI